MKNEFKKEKNCMIVNDCETNGEKIEIKIWIFKRKKVGKKCREKALTKLKNKNNF